MFVKENELGQLYIDFDLLQEELPEKMYKEVDRYINTLIMSIPFSLEEMKFSICVNRFEGGLLSCTVTDFGHLATFDLKGDDLVLTVIDVETSELVEVLEL